MKSAIIIGSGIAGLGAALRLRAKGYEVTVFEANSYAGGKLHAFEQYGYRFDYGPSLFTMPHFVEELFLLFDKKPADHFQYKHQPTICNYIWDDGTSFTAHADEKIFVQEASDLFSEPKNHLEKYLANSRKKYDLTARLFLEKSLHKIDTYISRDAIKGILGMKSLDLIQNLHQVNQSHFENPKLIQLFDRYATYNGSDPYQTPGIMSLIPQLEMHYGTYYPKGGMHSISQSLYRLAVDTGVQFSFDNPVKEIVFENNRVKGIVADRSYHADLVVCNMDVFSAYQTLLKKAKKPKRVLAQERSSSALIFYWGIHRTFDELDLHNIFFSNDYAEEFDAIFKRNTLGKDPTVYINITAKEDPEHAPPNSENWFVMINTPGNKGQDWKKLKKQARKSILKKLSNALQTDISQCIETEAILDPVRIESDTLSHEGSLYGTASNSRFAAFLRHPNFSSTIKDLYFCGGSAHPGGGIPLCLLSAKIVSDLIPEV